MRDSYSIGRRGPAGLPGCWVLAGRDAFSSPPLPKSYLLAPFGIRTVLCPGCPRTERLEHLLISIAVYLTEVELVDAPIVEVLLEGDDTALLTQVQLPRPVEVDHGAEAARMPVKVELVVLYRLVSRNLSVIFKIMFHLLKNFVHN